MADEKKEAGSAEVQVQFDLSDPAVAGVFQKLALSVEHYLALFAPQQYAAMNPEGLKKIVLGIMYENVLIQQQIMPLFTVEAAKDNPIVILQIKPASTPDDSQALRLTVKRRIEACQNWQEVALTALLIAFIDSPGMRAVLRVYGYTYMWIAPKQSRIIIPGPGFKA